MFKRGNLEKQVLKLPKEVKWCKKCVISNQRPKIIFDNNDICSACNNQEYNKSINWQKREEELLRLLDKYRSKNKEWDVVVPSSGGKDSGYVAHQLKYKYGMNPLLVTSSPLEYTDIGIRNYNKLNQSGFVSIKADPNGTIQRKLARLSFEELGDAFHIFVLGQSCLPTHIALKFNIKLIFYGENGSAEYAGDPKAADKSSVDLIENYNWLTGFFKGTMLNDLIDYGIKNKDYMKETDFREQDLKFYNLPSLKEMKEKKIHKYYYFSYFKKWHPQENFYYCVENTGFKPNDVRTEGTYTKYSSLDDKMDGMHYYLRYIKFGLGRCVEDASHEIREGHITRKEGVALMKKYEGEFPQRYFHEFLKYLDITQPHFWEVVDAWRPKHLWDKKGNRWELKNPIYK
jgi:N-acetyl sugar amidotransferase